MTTTRMLLLLSLLLPSLGCPGDEIDPYNLPEAPTELSDLSAYLFRNFESQEFGVLEVGMGNLSDFLVTDLGDAEVVAYQGLVITEEDLAGIERPDRDPADCQPVAVAKISAHDPDAHSTVMVLADQTPVEPNSPETYDRTFLDPTDPSCWTGRDCTALDTMNEIVKEHDLGYSIAYGMNKDYRWVELGEPESGVWGILGRSWCAEEAADAVLDIEINQSYSVDAFLPHEGGVIRYMGLYSENIMLDFKDEQIIGVTQMGIEDMFDETNAYLDDNS